MRLNEALSHIREIREVVSRSETFRGYRSIPIAFSGLLALAAGLVQSRLIAEPVRRLEWYFALWIGAAVVSVIAAGTGVWIHHRRHVTVTRTRLTWLAVEQFAPCLVAGAAVTVVLFIAAPESLWILPGLWSVLFSLGVLGASRLLGRTICLAGAWYLAAGLLCLGLARGEAAFSPWAMAGSFGGGQLLTAAILYFTLERNDERRES